MPKQKEKQTSKKIDKNLQETIDEIKQRFGDGAIMTLSGVRPVDVDAIPTGSLALDEALGVGGVPKGRIIEIFGPESSGKTTLALHVVAECQARKGTTAFIDAEHALDPQYAKCLGVKINDLLISQPDSGEQALQIVEALVRSGAVAVIVVDSVAALTPKAEIEGEMGEQHIGRQARLMSQALRKLAGITSKTGTSVVFLNQIRMDIGVRFGNPETTSGGKALKFYSSVRIKLKRIAKIKQGENIVGSRIRAQVVKNKVAAPFRTAEFDIYYNEGISQEADLINIGLWQGVIEKTGSWYSFGEEKLGQGLQNAKKFLKENPKVKTKIKKAILSQTDKNPSQ